MSWPGGVTTFFTSISPTSRRRFQEVEVGHLLVGRIGEFRPDIVIGCNLPLDTLDVVSKAAVARRWVFVLWQQDIYSRAIASIMTRRFGPLGWLVGRFYVGMERRALARSGAVVVIAEEFIATVERDYGIGRGKVHLVENWAPLDEITPRPKDNPWSRAHDLADREVVLYTGTLGMKHDPAQIVELARDLRSRPQAVVVVVSEGPAAEWVRETAAGEALDRLIVLPFQPFEVYSEVLGSAEVVISVLEPDAGSFSVPSKVLSYLSAGRAIVLSAPADNLASRIVSGAGAGITTAPGETARFIGAVRSLLEDQDARSACERSARAYAERTFDIVAIGSRFEAIFAEARTGTPLT